MTHAIFWFAFGWFCGGVAMILVLSLCAVAGAADEKLNLK